MKIIKKPALSSFHFIGYGLLISLLLTMPLATLVPVAYAEAPVTNAAPTVPTILGGQSAEVGEWPWQAVVMAGGSFCGGTLIHREWILTVAHCVYDPDKQLYPATAFVVTLGDYNLYTSDDSEQQVTIDRVVVHENLQFATYDNDIALLHLATPAVITPYVAPIALATTPQDEASLTPGTVAVVTGWGATEEHGKLAPILREVEVPLVANADCQQTYWMLTANMLCAGYPEGGKDACQGDSGGPLVVPAENDSWKLAGLVSFGYGCGRPLRYGVYTRVANYVEWIKNSTGPLEPLGEVTTVEGTATPPIVPTDRLTGTVTLTPVPPVSPTPAPSPTPESQPSPTPAEAAIPSGQNFLPVVYR